MISPATVNTATSREMMKARGKFVSVHASEKLLQFSGHGKLKPLPLTASCDVFRDIATVKYSGMRTANEATSRMIVSGQLTSPPRRLALLEERLATRGVCCPT